MVLDLGQVKNLTWPTEVKHGKPGPPSTERPPRQPVRAGPRLPDDSDPDSELTLRHCQKPREPCRGATDICAPISKGAAQAQTLGRRRATRAH